MKKIFIPLFIVITLLLIPQTSRAGQPRDYYVGVQPSGLNLNVDAVFPGAQLLLENRTPIYGRVNELDVRANGLFTLMFYESQLDVDLRIIILTVGGGFGYRDTFRNLSYTVQDYQHDPSVLDRHSRRNKEWAGYYDDQDWLFGEARFNLDLPFNDWVLFHNINTVRYEDKPDTSFDWRNGIISDGRKPFFKSDIMLFFKHRDIGALAPMAQILSFKCLDQSYAIANFGFFFVTRPGLTRRNDLLAINALFYGATLSGPSYAKIYGIHDYFIPINVTLAYRVILNLGG